MLRRVIQRARKRAIARGNRGFTLIEMLVAVSLGTVVVLPVMGLSISMSRNDLGAQQDKAIADDFGLLQMYVPRDVAQATSASTTGSDCTGGTASQGAGGTVKLVLVTRGSSPTRVVYSDAAPSSADSGGTISLYRRQCNDTTGALTGAVEMVTGSAAATTVSCTADPAHPTEGCWTVRISVGKKRTATAGPQGLGLLRTGAVSATRRPDRRLNATGISASPNPVRMGNAVAFTSTWDSVDGAAISSYKWDFGDGTSATTQNASHTYPNLPSGVNSRTYTATVVATTEAGSSSTRSIDVVVKRPEVLVSTAGTDNATCGDTATTTCRTITYALTKANRNTIWIASGDYAPFTTAGGWTIKGGFNSTFTTSSASTPTNIDGAVDGSLDAAYAVRVNGASSAVVLDTLRIRAMNNPGTLASGIGRSTYGLMVLDSASNLTMNAVSVFGGTAGAGRAGTAGTAASQTPAGGGAPGQGGFENGSACDTYRRPGGGGGGGGAANGGGGGAGGSIDTSCGFFNLNLDATGGYGGGWGATASGTCTPAGAGGGGGGANSGWWGGSGSNGGNGGAGCNGVAGAAGATSSATAGTLSAAGVWQAPTSVNGGNGTLGTHGAGGGGGGGGGGSDGDSWFGNTDDFGASGGGGGAGGFRATAAGTGGFGGGASIAVLVRNSTVAATGLNITKGTGGAGGAGGAGALGQPGGAGGAGGARFQSAGAGGNGGTGGRGGPSGAGSGGSGGPSYGVVTTSSGSLTGATFAAGGAAGTGGAAGPAVSGGAAGGAGQNGLIADTRAL